MTRIYIFYSKYKLFLFISQDKSSNCSKIPLKLKVVSHNNFSHERWCYQLKSHVQIKYDLPQHIVLFFEFIIFHKKSSHSTLMMNWIFLPLFKLFLLLANVSFNNPFVVLSKSFLVSFCKQMKTLWLELKKSAVVGSTHTKKA